MIAQIYIQLKVSVLIYLGENIFEKHKSWGGYKRIARTLNIPKISVQSSI